MGLNLVKGSFNAGILDESLSARTDLAKYGAGCKELQNFIPQASGGVYRRPGSRIIFSTVLPSGQAQKHALIPFQFNVAQTYMLLFIHNKIIVIANQEFLGYVASTYTADQVQDIHYEQSADILFLTHSGHPPRRFERLSATTFQLVTIDFSNSTQGVPTVFSATWRGEVGVVPLYYAIVAVSDTGDESDVVYDSITTGKPEAGWLTSNWATLAWTAPAGGADSYVLYKQRQGIYGYLGTVRGATTFKDYNYIPDISDSIPVANDPFGSAGNYPATVALHQQRLYFGATNNRPMTFWATRTGNFASMRYSEIPREDDSIELTLFSKQINTINWMVAYGGDLVIGTPGAEWKVTAIDGGAITTTTAINRQQSTWGSKNVMPLILGDAVLYIAHRGTKVHNIVYNDQVKGYAGTDLSVLAQSLFEGYEIVSWAYQRSPDSVVWCVRDDGVLLGLTYIREQQIFAWHKHITDGEVKSVAVIPGAKYDDVYITVDRNLPGSPAASVELLLDKWSGSDIKDAVFLDSHIGFNGSYVNENYVWVESGSGTNEYYILDKNMLDPWPDFSIYIYPGTWYTGPENLYEEAALLTPGAVGSLAVGEWAWDNNDSLGFSTVYVRLSDETDPNTKDDDYIRELADSLSVMNRNYLAGYEKKYYYEGDVVSGIVDGVFYENLVVAPGEGSYNYKVVFPSSGYKLALGRPYTSKLAPMGVEMDTKEGTTLGKTKAISQVTLRFKDTVGGKIGPTEDYMDDLKFDQDYYGQAIPPFTGDYKSMFPASYEEDGSFYIIQDQPLPMTILALIPEISFSER